MPAYRRPAPRRALRPGPWAISRSESEISGHASSVNLARSASSVSNPTLRDPLRSAAAIASLTASLIAATTTDPSRRKAALRVVELARCDATGKRPWLPEVLRVSKATEDKPKG